MGNEPVSGVRDLMTLYFPVVAIERIPGIVGKHFPKWYRCYDRLHALHIEHG